VKETTSCDRIKTTITGGFVMAGKRGMKHYPTSLKEQAVRLHLNEGLTIREINTQLSIADEQRVKKWCAIYRKKGLLRLQPQYKGRPIKCTRSALEQLEFQVQQLKMENELLRNFLYDMV
jgi:transposase